MQAIEKSSSCAISSSVAKICGLHFVPLRHTEYFFAELCHHFHDLLLEDFSPDTTTLHMCDEAAHADTKHFGGVVQDKTCLHAALVRTSSRRRFGLRASGVSLR